MRILPPKRMRNSPPKRGVVARGKINEEGEIVFDRDFILKSYVVYTIGVASTIPNFGAGVHKLMFDFGSDISDGSATVYINWYDNGNATDMCSRVYISSETDKYGKKYGKIYIHTTKKVSDGSWVPATENVIANVYEECF